ncbi:hypothetical protein ACFL2Q_12650 [Thermodesulfobacteriota bacterium]
MKRVLVSTSLVCFLLVVVAIPGHCMYPYPNQGSCGPKSYNVTKMVPCVRMKCVPQVVPCKTVVPVQKIGYKCQKVLVKGTPVGCPQGIDPCTKCCPQPFCKVVTRKVPYVYCVQQCVPSYKVIYKRVACPVWLPQTYRVCETPMCY